MRHHGWPTGAFLLAALAGVPAGATAAAPGPIDRAAATLLLAGSVAAVLLLLASLFRVRRSRDRIAARNADLAAANASLEQALKARTDFLANTSHEIRTPLNGILGMTQVLLADRRLDGWLRERIRVVHGAGEAMKALIDDILDLAKIESGNLAFEHVAFDLRALLDDAGQLWRGQAEAKGVRLDLDIAGCPRRIEGDPARIRQIVFNLMSNALKFTADGAIGLSATAASEGDGEVLIVQVRDTGIGIAPDRQALVFERFAQADASTARKFGGTGLGLPICRSLAEAMGGTIALASRPGEGSVFTVTLPLRRADESDGNDGRRSPAAIVATLCDARLLVVEQNPLTRRILCNMLREAAGGIVAVATAAEAGERIAAGEIDHVVADAASLIADESASIVPLERLASHAAAAGARMTLLFASARSGQAAALVATRGEVQAIAKPIAAPALIDELRRSYLPAAADAATPRTLAAASAG